MSIVEARALASIFFINARLFHPLRLAALGATGAFSLELTWAEFIDAVEGTVCPPVKTAVSENFSGGLDAKAPPVKTAVSKNFVLLNTVIDLAAEESTGESTDG